jgi:N-acetylglucosamine kinase-like BadF-type ATPase/TusA-related sulfurtransferase
VPQVVDARGLRCPLPLVRARQALAALAAADTLVVLATDPEAPIDLAALAADAGREFSVRRDGDEWRIALAPRVAGVDVGASGIRVRLGEATVVSPRRGGALLDELRAAWPGGGVAAVAVGMTGLLTLTGDPERLQRELAALCRAPVLLASDVLTSHVGALGLEPGAVVAAGTGAVALGTDLRGCWARSDGWGHLLGDDGGGAWIGAAGLRAALRAHDGRAGGSPALLERVVARFGPPDTLPAQLYPHADVARRLAAFAPDVAAAGDSVAAAIVAEAGRRLAGTAAAALHPSLPRRVSWAGGLWRLPGLLDAFLAALDAEPVEPAGDALDGAVALARLAVSDPARLPGNRDYLRPPS